MWKRVWGATLFCSHGASNARRGPILIRYNFDCTDVKESIVASIANGRLITLKVFLSGEPALLVNIYAPNRDNELITFYRSLREPLRKNNLDDIENIIHGRDFKKFLKSFKSVIYKRGGNMILRKPVVSITEP